VSYRVTVRRGPKVERERCASLDEALDAVKRHVRGARRRGTVEALGRRYEPGALVAVRIEVSAPRRRAGLDVRGDGSIVAYRGRVFRKALDGDDPYDALQRALRA
jgi:hypothetical protein